MAYMVWGSSWQMAVFNNKMFRHNYLTKLWGNN